jgi:hypothetical protein
MQRIPLAPVPNQKCAVRLDGALYEIAVKTARTIMVADITRDGVLVMRNAPCLPLRPFVPYRHLAEGGGNFLFTTKDGAYPHYSRFGGEDALYYLTPEEIMELRNG